MLFSSYQEEALAVGGKYLAPPPTGEPPTLQIKVEENPIDNQLHLGVSHILEPNSNVTDAIKSWKTTIQLAIHEDDTIRQAKGSLKMA